MDEFDQLDTIMNTTKEVLKTDNRARNSDKWLILSVLRKLGFKIFINYDDLEKMPSFETITRCGRKLRELHDDLKPDEDVEEKRKELRSQYSEYFSDVPRGITIENKQFISGRGIEIFERKSI
jgi:hypothetical protein